MASAEPYDLIEEKDKQSSESFIPSIGKQHLFEAGLTNMECTKNPGHPTFIPRAKYTLEHLPPGYQDQLMHDWVDTTAELTGLLTVRHVSEGRPETVPGTLDPYPCGNARGQDLCQTGTGYVEHVEPKFYTQEDDKPCPCGVCAVSETPSFTWGKFRIQTATHVVVDDMEARSSDIRLFYRSGGKWDIQVKVSHGVGVAGSHVCRDWCKVVYVTHEKTVHDTLKETCWQWKGLCADVNFKYRQYNNGVVGRPAIIVSYPHSAHQHITVGKVTHVEQDGEDHERLTYTTDTCPGSSGALVLVPGRYGVWFPRLPHSRACPHGQPGNQSAFGLK